MLLYFSPIQAIQATKESILQLQLEPQSMQLLMEKLFNTLLMLVMAIWSLLNTQVITKPTMPT